MGGLLASRGGAVEMGRGPLAAVACPSTAVDGICAHYWEPRHRTVAVDSWESHCGAVDFSAAVVEAGPALRGGATVWRGSGYCSSMAFD